MNSEKPGIESGSQEPTQEPLTEIERETLKELGIHKDAIKTGNPDYLREGLAARNAEAAEKAGDIDELELPTFVQRTETPKVTLRSRFSKSFGVLSKKTPSSESEDATPETTERSGPEIRWKYTQVPGANIMWQDPEKKVVQGEEAEKPVSEAENMPSGDDAPLTQEEIDKYISLGNDKTALKFAEPGLVRKYLQNPEGEAIELPGSETETSIKDSPEAPKEEVVIPLMITQEMRVKLKESGMNDDEIKELKPAEAWEIIKAKEEADQQINPDETPEEKAEREKLEADVQEQLAQLPPEEREKVGLKFRNMGYWVEEKKNQAFSKVFGLVAGDRNIVTRAFRSLKADSDVKAEDVRKKMELIERGDDKKWGNRGYLAANALRYGRIITDAIGVTAAMPFRYWMMGTAIGTKVVGAFKEGRLTGESVKEKTRVQDIDRAADEAWALYRKAEAEAGGRSLTAEDFKKVYEKNLPKDILDRLARGEEGESMGFFSKVMEFGVKNAAEKAQKKLTEIENSQLTPEQKKFETDKLLAAIHKKMADYDRMISDNGRVDALAQTLRGTEMVGKAAQALLMMQTAEKILATSLHGYEEVYRLLHSEFTEHFGASHLIPEGASVHIPDTTHVPVAAPVDSAYVAPDTAHLTPDTTHIAPDTTHVSGVAPATPDTTNVAEAVGPRVTVPPTGTSTVSGFGTGEPHAGFEKGVKFEDYINQHNSTASTHTGMFHAPDATHTGGSGTVSGPESATTAEKPDSIGSGNLQENAGNIAAAKAAEGLPTTETPSGTETIGTIKEGSSISQTLHELVKSGKITEEQYHALANNPESGAMINGHFVQVDKIGLVHPGTHINLIHGVNGAPDHIEISNDAHMGSDEDYAKNLISRGKPLPHWLEESTGIHNPPSAVETPPTVTEPINVPEYFDPGTNPSVDADPGHVYDHFEPGSASSISASAERGHMAFDNLSDSQLDMKEAAQKAIDSIPTPLDGLTYPQSAHIEFQHGIFGGISGFKITEIPGQPITHSEITQLYKEPNLDHIKIPNGMSAVKAHATVENNSKSLALIRRVLMSKDIGAAEAKHLVDYAKNIVSSSNLFFGDIYKSDILPKI